MNRFRNLFGLAVAIMLVLAVCAAIAGSVYDRTSCTMATTTGAGTFTNSTIYAAAKLTKICIESSLNATSVVSVSRVYTADNGSVYTNTLPGVTASGGKGETIMTNYYLKTSDKLVFGNAPATGGVVVIEYEVQKH